MWDFKAGPTQWVETLKSPPKLRVRDHAAYMTLCAVTGQQVNSPLKTPCTNGASMSLEKTSSTWAISPESRNLSLQSDKPWFSYFDTFEWKEFQNAEYIFMPLGTERELISLCFALMVSAYQYSGRSHQGQVCVWFILQHPAHGPAQDTHAEMVCRWTFPPARLRRYWDKESGGSSPGWMTTSAVTSSQRICPPNTEGMSEGVKTTQRENFSSCTLMACEPGNAVPTLCTASKHPKWVGWAGKKDTRYCPPTCLYLWVSIYHFAGQ